MGCLLQDTLPPIITLRRFCLSPKASHTLFILDSWSETERYVVTRDPEVESTFLRIYDVINFREEIVGHIVKYRKMRVFEFGDYYVRMERYRVEKPKPTNVWACEKLTFYEGEAGCLLLNTCGVRTVASSMIETI